MVTNPPRNTYGVENRASIMPDADPKRTMSLSDTDLFHIDLPRQGSHPLRVLSPPLNVNIHALVSPRDACTRSRRDSVVAQLPLRNRHGVLPDAVLVCLLGTSQNRAEPFSRTHLARVARGCRRDNLVSVRSRPFDDGARPSRDEFVCNARDVWSDTLAFRVEQHDLSQPGLFEDGRVDELHLAYRVEQFALNVQRRKRPIWQRLEPSLDGIQEIIVDHGLRERDSGEREMRLRAPMRGSHVLA